MLRPDATPPADCSDMHDIRREIDDIDGLIVSLLGDRLGYVHAAAAFKTSEVSVRALDRVETMLADRERWAVDAGLQPAVVRQLFQTVIDAFTEAELQRWTDGS